MSIASKIKNIINTQCKNCFSLYAGYGISDGQYIRFPQGTQLLEKRNTKGRVIKAIYKYADNSHLTYTYSITSNLYRISTKEA